MHAGADVNAKDERGFTPLMRAAGNYSQNPQVVEALLTAGADVNAKDKDGWAPAVVCRWNPLMIEVL